MKVVFASSEISPFIKTGGLADVSGSLPGFIDPDEFDLMAVMPLYRNISRDAWDIEYLTDIQIPHAGSIARAGLYRSKLPGSHVTVYFLDYGPFFDRDGIYGENNSGYEDNDARFSLFCRGVLETCRAIDFQPDVIHCNDWQTGLIPVYLRILYADDLFFTGTGVLFTIHNLAYRGLFDPARAMRNSGLPWSVFNMYGLEFYGSFSFLKGGIYYSTLINTVSRRYSKEIQTEEYGEGLHGLLKSRCPSLSGIINGVDYEIWNPSTDPYIKKNYSASDIENKKTDTSDLCALCGFDYNEEIPVIGMITRLAAQKGIDLAAGIMNCLAKKDVRFILLGTGEQYYHKVFSDFAEKYPDKICVFLKHDDRLSHKIYAGSDIFLMPSRFEPCGLGQLISLKYGTIPVVRETGGLADTIVPYSSSPSGAGGAANGFVFSEYSCEALSLCIESSLELYSNRQEWKRLMLNAMKYDFSWEQSAKQYEGLYRRLSVIKRGGR